jgi:subtilisin family serine protease
MSELHSAKKILSFSLITTLLFSLISFTASPVEALKAPSKTANYVVRYKSNVNFAKAIGMEFKRGVKPTSLYTTIFPGFSARLTPSNWVRLKKDRSVASISEVKTYSIPRRATLRSPSYVWGLDRINQRQLPLDNSSKNSFDGSGVTAYVIDSGVDGSHPEFAGRMQSGFSSIRGSLPSIDCSGHGTHVAGTLAGRNVGVARNAQIVPVKVFPCSGGTSTETILRGIEFVIGHHQRGNPAVANLSLGGPVDSALDYGIRALVADGIATVVAAGNSNADACTVSPARERLGITVGASTPSDVRASFSNFGSCLDVFAPGQEILSAWPGGSYALLNGTSMASPHVAGIAALMLQANPNLTPSQVESLIKSSSTRGLLASIGRNSPNALAFSDSITSPPNNPIPTTTTSTTLPVPTTTLPPTTPGLISSLTATPGDSSAFVVWAAPTSNGRSAITDYRVEFRLGTNGAWSVFQDGVSTATAAIVTGLANTSEYYFRVSAINTVGTGPSVATPGVTIGVPSNQPVVTSAQFRNPWTNSPETSLVLGQSGGQVAFRVTLQAAGVLPNGSSSVQGQLCPVTSTYPSGVGCTGSLFPYESGTRSDATYGALFILGNQAPSGTYVATFDIQLTNGSSARVVSPITIQVSAFVPSPPSAPTGISATASTSSVTLTWARPTSDGGAPITDYVVDVWARGGSSYTRFQDGVSTSTSATVTNLPSNTYSFRVAAVNSAGIGSWISTGDVVVTSALSVITSDKYSRTIGGTSISTLTLATSGITWVYYEVNLTDASGSLPSTMGGQLCPDNATYPDFNRCTGSTFGRSGSGFSANYVGLFGIGAGGYKGLWKVTFDASSRVESPRKLTVR